MTTGSQPPETDTTETAEAFETTEPALVLAADVVLGVAAGVGGVVFAAATGLASGGRRLGRLVPRPAVPARLLSPEGPLATTARRGRRARLALAAEVVRIVRSLVPGTVRLVLDELDLTAVVRERVDLEALAKTLNVDAVAARLDVDAIIERVDMDRIIERIDINAVAARLDLDAIVARIDLIALADYVVDGIDLPGIVRESSGAMASEALSGVRLQSLEGDEALSRAVSRWLPRRRAPVDSPGQQP